MSRIQSEDTAPEMAVRSFLRRSGFRFRLHVKSLPGKPDIVLPKYKTIIDVKGCFWHRHPGCKDATMPSSHVKFWQEKFDMNIARDKRTEAELTALGWIYITVWECELKHPDFADNLIKKIRLQSAGC